MLHNGTNDGIYRSNGVDAESGVTERAHVKSNALKILSILSY